MSGTIPASIQVAWAGEGRFDASRAGGPSIRLDTSTKTGPTPVETLLAALASCTAVDVVDILAKRRTPVESLTIDVQSQRVDGTPKRLARATLNFTIAGVGVERVHAERAIDLSVNKYCSVRDSLRPDVPVDWTLALNGEPSLGPPPGDE